MQRNTDRPDWRLQSGNLPQSVVALALESRVSTSHYPVVRADTSPVSGWIAARAPGFRTVTSVWIDRVRSGNQVLRFNRQVEKKISRGADHYEASMPELGLAAYGRTRTEAEKGLETVIIGCYRRFSDASPDGLYPYAAQVLAKIERVRA